MAIHAAACNSGCATAACDTPCATAAPAPIQYEDRKVTAYKYVTVVKEIDTIVCKRVTRDEKFTYTVCVPHCRTECYTTYRDECYTTCRMVQEQHTRMETRHRCYTVPEEYTRSLEPGAWYSRPTCAIVFAAISFI